MKDQPGKPHIIWAEHIGFAIIVALSWLTEIMRLPHVLYGEPFTPNWHRAILRTVVVVIVWAWVFFETSRLLRRLHHLEEFLLVCPWCRRIGDHGTWYSMEKYFGAKFATQTTHGMCPECAEKVVAQGTAPAPKS